MIESVQVPSPGASATGLGTCTLSIIKGSYDQLMTMQRYSRSCLAPQWHSSLKREARRIRMDVPLAACEIGESLGSPILCYRCFTQWSSRTPCGGIVDIDIGDETPFQAIHEAVIHDVVHSTVATHFAGQFSGCLPQWMLILFAKRIEVLPILQL